MLNLTHDGKNYANWSEADLLEAGVPQAAIDAALTAQRVGDIKTECRRRIYNVASVETQMNISAASGVIGGKTASARTDAEKAILAGAEAAIGWVAAMRTNITALAADADADITADASWPAPAAEVTALAAQF